jgi:hypothetical protein
MYPLAGEKYVPTNKFNFLYWSLAMVFGFFITIGVGRLYAIISFINPIIYLNFLVLGGTVIVMVAIITGINSIGQSRNKRLNNITSFIICATTWLAQWAHLQAASSDQGFWARFFNISGVIDFALTFGDHREKMRISRMGSGGFDLDPGMLFFCYLAEFIAFMAPIYLMAKTKSYYCEDCQNEYSTITGYMPNNDILQQHTEQLAKGDLNFLQNTIFHKKLDTLLLDPKLKPGIGLVEFHYCKKCNANAIANVKSGILKSGDKKNSRQMGDVQVLLEDTYITNESNKILATNIDRSITY